jgi:hypothetical protein
VEAATAYLNNQTASSMAAPKSDTEALDAAVSNLAGITK